LSGSKSNLTVNKENRPLSKYQGIPANDFELLLRITKNFLECGNPEIAGRTINPVFPHLNRDQQSHLVKSLEPSMNSLYEKAYMLMRYDHNTAIVALEMIVGSGLTMLPSYEKARLLIESEKKVENSLDILKNIRNNW
jgi:hypothetical protein